MNFEIYLKENILGFWLNNAIDSKHGGIFTCLDREGNVYDTTKSCWFQGRALWTFSKAYNLIEKNPAYLEAAGKIFDFIPKCIDSDGRMFFTVTREGISVQKRRYWFSEAFAIIGCAEYYKATKSKAALDLAEKLFDSICNLYHNPGLTVPKYNPETMPFKSHSPVMILFSTAQAMRSLGINELKYDAIVMETMNELLNGGFINHEVGALFENVTTDGKFSDTQTGRLVNPGHALETAWFLLAEGAVTGRDKAISAAKDIIDYTMPIGWDTKNGGILSFIDIKSKPVSALEWDMKLWWPQCEGIIANLLAYKTFGDKKYMDNYNMILDYALSHFADEENGEWYGYLHYDGTVSATLKGNIFKGPFHLPRMLFILSSLHKSEDILTYMK